MSAISTAYPSRPTDVCTTFDCVIANLRLIVSVLHPRVEQRRTTVAAADAAELNATRHTSPTRLRPFATGWAHRGNTVSDLVVDRDTLTASGQATITPPPLWRPRPQDLVIDAFVVTLQVGQILLYELDQLDRADSNTLWMRHTEIRWGPQPRPSVPDATTTTITKPRILSRDAARWRVADIHGDVYGVVVRCAVAHRLP
jgi:hypothetical protein